MGFNRRDFLQKIGLSLLTYEGIFNAFPRISWLNKYGKTLAQSNSRKLALLVGINKYSQENQLQGCLTDVELQKELLIYRFGFNPQDILILTEKEATRENIETAFSEHLIKQAKPDDVVIFHFSGYGRKVQIDSSTMVNSLIPQDGLNENSSIANDILIETLFLLSKSIPTNKLTMILDTSYQKPLLSCFENLPVRSFIREKIPKISKQELAFIEQLKLNLKKDLNLNLTSDKRKGIILTTKEEGIATEIITPNLKAGLFTYFLTQYLWESVSPNNMLISLGEVSSKIGSFTKEIETFKVESNLDKDIFPYYLFPEKKLAGVALIKNINSDNLAEIDLIGLPILILLNYGINSCFYIKKDSLNIIKIQITERKGIKASGLILNSNHNLKPGDILKESVRVISRNLGLKVGLNSDLERIEKVDATSTLSSIKEIESVVNVGEDLVDCILHQFSIDSSYPLTYGLSSPLGITLPNTISKNPNEAVSSAVNRLIPQFKNLLASKLIHLTFNQNSSVLPVNIELKIKTDKEVYFINKNTLGNQENNLNINNKKQPSSNQEISQDSLIDNFTIASEITVNITNYSDNDIYICLLGINSEGEIKTYIFSENNLINAGKTVNFPQEVSPLKWIINPTEGLGELIVIACKSPFNKTFLKLYKSISMKSDIEQIITLDNPVIIAKTLLEDLHIASNLSNDLINNLTDVYALDINTWATINFIYQI